MTDQIYTKLDQDVELSSAIGKFKNPNELQQYLQTQLDKVFKDVTMQKDSTFQKVYGNLTQSVKSQESNIMYNNRNMEISKLNKNTYDTQKKNANNIKQDKDLYNRKYEMNEWSVNNRKDTLFVFSMLFIMLSGLLFITGLWSCLIGVAISSSSLHSMQLLTEYNHFLGTLIASAFLSHHMDNRDPRRTVHLQKGIKHFFKEAAFHHEKRSPPQPT